MRRAPDINYRLCDQAFRKYCADELVDPRLEEVLEEAFIAGYVAGVYQSRAVLEQVLENQVKP